MRSTVISWKAYQFFPRFAATDCCRPDEQVHQFSREKRVKKAKPQEGIEPSTF